MMGRFYIQKVFYISVSGVFHMDQRLRQMIKWLDHVPEQQILQLLNAMVLT